MGVATVAFRKCVINSRADGADNDDEASRVVFDLDAAKAPRLCSRQKLSETDRMNAMFRSRRTRRW